MQVLEAPAPLGDLAAAFLAAHASRVRVDTGPGDDECRAMMREVLGHSGEQALAGLRSLQRRYSGLTHLARLRARHPRLQRIDAASGFCLEWWGDGDRLVFFNGLDASLASDGHGTSPVPTVVTTWSVPS